MFKVWLGIQLSLNYIFTAKFGSEKNLKSVTLGKVTGKNVDCLCALFALRCPA